MRSYPTKLPSDSVNAELPAFFFLFSILYEKGEGRQVAQHKLGFCAKTQRKSPVAQKSVNALLSIRDGLPISRAIMEQFNFSLYCSFVIFCLWRPSLQISSHNLILPPHISPIQQTALCDFRLQSFHQLNHLQYSWLTGESIFNLRIQQVMRIMFAICLSL